MYLLQGDKDRLFLPFFLMALQINSPPYHPVIHSFHSSGNILQLSNAQNEKYQTVRFLESLPFKGNLRSNLRSILLRHGIPTINIKFENIMTFVMKMDSYKENIEFLVHIMYFNRITKVSLLEIVYKCRKNVF